MKQRQKQINDYLTFSIILIAVSVFFYLGLKLTGRGKSPEQISLLLCTTFIFIKLAFVFRLHTVKLYQQQAQDDKSSR